MKKIWAICDAERSYMIHLMEFLNQKSGIPFEVQVFTDPEKLMAYAGEHAIELLLVSENAYREEMEALGCTQILILSERGRMKSSENHQAVYKYQSADHMVREVLDCYSAERRAIGPEEQGVRQCRKIAVFNYSDASLREAVALGLGDACSSSQKTLYLCLADGLGLEFLAAEVWDRNLSDLIYFYRKRREMLAFRLGGTVRRMGNLDLVPPVSDHADLRALDGAEWNQFLATLVNGSAYDVLILEFGMDFPYWKEVLDDCEEIYEPVADNPLASASAEQLERRVDAELGNEVSGKICRLCGNLPHQVMTRGNAVRLQDLGSLGVQLQQRLPADFRIQV